MRNGPAKGSAWTTPGYWKADKALIVEAQNKYVWRTSGLKILEKIQRAKEAVGLSDFINIQLKDSTLAHYQSWTRSVFDEVFGIAAEEQVFPTGISMRR